jgi:hypothetical protein
MIFIYLLHLNVVMPSSSRSSEWVFLQMFLHRDCLPCLSILAVGSAHRSVIDFRDLIIQSYTHNSHPQSTRWIHSTVLLLSACCCQLKTKPVSFLGQRSGLRKPKQHSDNLVAKLNTTSGNKFECNTNYITSVSAQCRPTWERRQRWEETRDSCPTHIANGCDSPFSSCVYKHAMYVKKVYACSVPGRMCSGVPGSSLGSTTVNPDGSFDFSVSVQADCGVISLNRQRQSPF